MNHDYSILLEDTGRTFNINMHTFDCFAPSKEAAIEKMEAARPEFKGRKIHKITQDGKEVYIDAEFKANIENALKSLKKK